jgi:hypothetical protein
LTKNETQKVKAILQARMDGLSREEIIAAGQSEILSRAAKNRKNHSEPQRMLRWRVSRSLAEAIQWTDQSSPDAEEALITRIRRVCHIETSEDLWEFFFSVFADRDDKWLRNEAGVILEKKQKSAKR